ncbi:MAG: twin-arginine translocase TatA/TatE family subunit [Legionellales bacterium]|nr:twin-arginine translocase TatA/TatE family subunit [Legionellales bacterium]
MGISGISPLSLLLILLIVLVLFGGKRLKSLGRDLGAALKSFRQETDGIEKNQATESESTIDAKHDDVI